MNTLVTRIALGALLALPLAAVAVDAPAAPAAKASVVRAKPSRVVSLDWLQGQIAWRAATLARLPRSTFEFSNGRFKLYQPGFAPLVGRYRVSGKTVRFSGSYRQTNYPNGKTVVDVSGVLDTRTGRTTLGYEAYQILVANPNGQELELRNHVAWKAEVVLRRI